MNRAAMGNAFVSEAADHLIDAEERIGEWRKRMRDNALPTATDDAECNGKRYLTMQSLQAAYQELGRAMELLASNTNMEWAEPFDAASCIDLDNPGNFNEVPNSYRRG